MKNDVMIIVGVVVGLLLGSAGVYFLLPKTDVTPLESQISDLQASKAQLESQVHNLQVQATEYETQIQQITQQILDMEEDYAILEAEYDNISDDKTLLQTTLSQKNAELGYVYEQIDDLEGQLVDLQEQITTLKELTLIGYISSSFSYSGDIASTLEELLDNATSSVMLMVTTIHTGDLSNALIAAHNRSVDVKIVIDTDERYKPGSAFTSLLTSGVDVRGDVSSKIMNHKALIVDSHIIAVGSYDWTLNAEVNNDESYLILDSTEIAAPYIAEFNRIWNQTSPEELEGDQSGLSIVINEIEMNPEGSDPGYEWVELFNPTNQTVDISLWWVQSTGGTTQFAQYIPYSTTIDPQGFYILYATQQWFDNQNEMVLLKNYEQEIIDSSPIIDDIGENNYTWQRMPNGYDTDLPSDWIFAQSTKNDVNIGTEP